MTTNQTTTIVRLSTVSVGDRVIIDTFYGQVTGIVTFFHRQRGFHYYLVDIVAANGRCYHHVGRVLDTVEVLA